ncbi:hypothetical protein KY289_031903 [Solanum tuberosum]|nr:hypothetical protein KY289_031903 [Solanum tuberosum]
MARPFILPPLTPAKAEPSTRPELAFQNKFSALADFPRLPCPTQPKLPKLLCPPQPKLINLRPIIPPIQEASSSSVQTKASYAMKTPESFAQAVLPLMALNKDYENVDVGILIKPCYTDFNYVDTENPLKTRRFYEAILIDTESIEIEHSRDANNYIQYSRITIKKILDPFEWFADHLHTLIALTMAHKPQTYNWYDYKAAWMDFLYLRLRHTWFVKYSPNIIKAIIPRFEEFQTKEGITTLPEHIKLCKFFMQKRISYIITWNFSKTNVDRVQYLCKQIQVKGWVPKQPNAKAQEKVKLPKKLSKAALRQKLKEAMDNLDDYDENQIMRMIEDAASTESSSEDNGDMCNPKGLALAYMESDYE